MFWKNPVIEPHADWNHAHRSFHLSPIHWAATPAAFFTVSQFAARAMTATAIAAMMAMTGRKATLTAPWATATIAATAAYALMAALTPMMAAATTPSTVANGVSHDAFCCTHDTISVSFCVTCVTTGSSAWPNDACAFSHMAFNRCCWPCAVSASLAKLPVASAVCAVIAARMACILALRSPALYRSSMPMLAACACRVASFRLTPYASMGSISPLSAELRASTACVVVPPNMLDRSAPRVISSLVLDAVSSMLMPAFFNWLPITVASSL